MNGFYDILYLPASENDYGYTITVYQLNRQFNFEPSGVF